MFNKRMFYFNEFHLFSPFKKQIEEFYIRNIELPSIFIMTVGYKNNFKIDRTLIKYILHHHKANGSLIHILINIHIIFPAKGNHLMKIKVRSKKIMDLL